MSVPEKPGGINYLIYPGEYSINKRIKIGGGGIIRYETHVSQDKSSLFSIDDTKTLILSKSNGTTQTLFKLSDTMITIPIALGDFSGTWNWDGWHDGNIIKVNDMDCFNMCFGTGNSVQITIPNCPGDIVDVVGLCYHLYGKNVFTYNYTYDISFDPYDKKISITVDGYYSESVLSLYMRAGNQYEAKYLLTPRIYIWAHASNEPVNPFPS